MVRRGGSETKGGLYWNKGEWEIVTVEGKKGILPGTADVRYLRIPMILFAPVAMIVSIAYVVFLPFVGFAMLLAVIVKKIRSGGLRLRVAKGANVEASNADGRGGTLMMEGGSATDASDFQ